MVIACRPKREIKPKRIACAAANDLFLVPIADTGDATAGMRLLEASASDKVALLTCPRATRAGHYPKTTEQKSSIQHARTRP